ncbi:g-protein beta WD-40 repeat-containing protein [Cyclospora cayetanensis]|uniref:Pre-mRNA-processing factor 17 n=1 Tax=Cyclospora cayetanensis TaxID=88456 RepID=A0A1D3D867_9EIME|nr:g-protein beta WD-40 repeat-containing protein [Cyclospora cayetanensis]
MDYFASYAEAEGSPSERKRHMAMPEDGILLHNPKIDAVEAPIVGPLTPLQEQQGGLQNLYKKRLCGDVEPAHLSKVAFDAEYHKFASKGVATDPSDGAATAAAAEGEAAVEAPLRQAAFKPLPLHGEISIGNISSASSSVKTTRKERKACRLQRNTDVESEEFQGPWALYMHPATAAAEAAAAAKARAGGEDGLQGASSLGGREEAAERGDGAKAEVVVASLHGSSEAKSSASVGSAVGAAAASLPAGDCVFHRKELVDYQGRSWLAPPPHLKPLSADASFYVPRECIHSFVGHTGVVQAIRLFPSTGHLLLSASLDSTVKIWDVYNQRKCQVTYTAHKQGVRDLQWAEGGSRFFSCSYDNTIKLWDTERGQVISTFSNKKTPYCVAVYPPDNNIFIAGCSNKRAVQFDARTGEVVVEYADHLGAVNTVFFCEGGRRVVTTADDKKMFVWEFGIPVVIKHIADPEMHAMPAGCLHPSSRYLCFQSMANEVVTYEAANKYRFVPRKKFKGHLSAGYAIQPAFSPDGRYLLSGDSTGRLFFWEFKSGRIVRTLKAHNKVCMGCQWHPTAQSRVFTCGWDGLIKLWD